jgi:hypothetical protein
MKTKQPTQVEVVADAMRRVAANMQKEWDDGKRSTSVYIDDLTTAFLDVADELDPSKSHGRRHARRSSQHAEGMELGATPEDTP